MVVRLHYGYICWVTHERREHSVSAAMDSAPVRRAQMCLQLLWLLESSASFPDCALPTLGSMNRVHSETQKDNWCSWQDQQNTWKCFCIFGWDNFQDMNKIYLILCGYKWFFYWNPDVSWGHPIGWELTWVCSVNLDQKTSKVSEPSKDLLEVPGYSKCSVFCLLFSTHLTPLNIVFCVSLTATTFYLAPKHMLVSSR